MLSAGDLVYARGEAIEPVTFSEGAGGGGGPYTYEVTPSPPKGPAFDPMTRVLSGTPSVAIDETTYTYTATHSGGSGSETFTITVKPPPVILDWDLLSRPREEVGSVNSEETYDVGGANVTVTISGDTDAGDFESSGDAQSPTVSSYHRGGLNPRENSLLLHMDRLSHDRESSTITLDFAHTGGVSDVSFTLFDVDGRPIGLTFLHADKVAVTATAGGVAVTRPRSPPVPATRSPAITRCRARPKRPPTRAPVTPR